MGEVEGKHTPKGLGIKNMLFTCSVSCAYMFVNGQCDRVMKAVVSSVLFSSVIL